MPLTFKRQTLISAYDGDKCLGTLHQKADGLVLSVAQNDAGKFVPVPVAEETLVDIAHKQALLDQLSQVETRLAESLGAITGEQLAAAAALVNEYGILFESEVVNTEAAITDEGGSVLEDDAPASDDPAGATMIGSGELVHADAGAADESNF